MDLLAALRLYVRVVDTGSFSAVAQETGQGQPAISKIIAGLESHLGTRLLQRTTRRHALSDDGRLFYEQAKAVLEAAAAAEGSVGRRRGRPEGHLRVGATGGFGRWQLVPRLGRFQALYPDISVELVLSDSRADLIGQGIDVTLRIGPLSDSGYVGHRLGESRRILAASSAYLAAAGVPQRLEDLARHQCLRYSQLMPSDHWDIAGQPAPVPVGGRLTFNSSEALREAALAGLGIARIVTWSLGDALAAGRLVPVLPGFEPPRFPVTAVWPSRRFTPPKVRAWVDFLEQEFANEPTLQGQ